MAKNPSLYFSRGLGTNKTKVGDEMIEGTLDTKSCFMEVICKRTNKPEDTVVSVGEASASPVGIWTRQSEITGETRREDIMGFSLLYVRARNLIRRQEDE